MNDINKKQKRMHAICDYAKHFVTKTIVKMNYKDNKHTNNFEDKPKFRLMYSILIKNKLYTTYQNPFNLYYDLQNDKLNDTAYMLYMIMRFCEDAWFNPEKFDIEEAKYESDMINKLSFEDFEKPEHKESELIKETEDYVATAITDAEFKELFGFAYPF